MGNYQGSASGNGYDPIKGARDVRDLGGLSLDDLATLDGLANDGRRRLTLTNWFGSHGGRWAWDVYCAARGGRPKR